MQAWVTHGTGDSVGVGVIVSVEHVADVEARPLPGVGICALFEEHDIVAELQAGQRAHAFPPVLVDLKSSIDLLLLLQLLLDLGLALGCGMQRGLRGKLRQ